METWSLTAHNNLISLTNDLFQFYNHDATYKVVDEKSADLLVWIEKTGEEIFVGEQAIPPLCQPCIKVTRIHAKNNVTAKHDNDTIQILKRKFDEITQTKQSPLKIAKR
ncbi:7933_t:CDS:2 [Entrophospora sp. SA101]|nr:10200_t:CDS:2 [Entrophospora sp. SA101]CAJ0628178.1 6862_t:CDS:2 [Entrophospora sp. SA101]CAJ0765464.1 7933_t:CDS:2 [Entrophospora sp. SA101]